jgi:hypothetical protein
MPAEIFKTGEFFQRIVGSIGNGSSQGARCEIDTVLVARTDG